MCARLEGKGKMAYRDGHVFEGEFKNWIKDGAGKMTYRNGDLYIGTWKGDDGKGSITHKDGSSYEGEFRGEKKHGLGTYTLPSGNKYTGMYKVTIQRLESRINPICSRMILRMVMEPSSGRMATSSLVPG